MRDRLFNIALYAAAVIFLFVMAMIVYLFVAYSIPAFNEFGVFNFLRSAEWDPRMGAEQYGASPFLVGSLSTALVALLISIPFALSIALFNGVFYADKKASSWAQTLTNTLANIPGIIYGIWGFYSLRPILATLHIGNNGMGILTAGIVLGIMVVPFAASVSTSMIRKVPQEIKEAAYAMGATRTEVITKVCIPYARKGIIASFLLAFTKVFGEAIVATMLIGNSNYLPTKITDAGNTLSSIIIDQIATGGDLKLSALIAIGLILLIITLTTNLIAQQMIRRYNA